MSHGGGGSQGVLTAAFRRMDADKSGTVRVEEIKHFLVQTQRGMEQVSWKVLDAIVDLCDADGAGDIDYAELSKLILCDDIVELLDGANIVGFSGKGEEPNQMRHIKRIGRVACGESLQQLACGAWCL